MVVEDVEGVEEVTQPVNATEPKEAQHSSVRNLDCRARRGTSPLVAISLCAIGIILIAVLRVP